MHRGIDYGERLRAEIGDVYMLVSPTQVYVNSSNAEANHFITSRRNDFVKPTEFYGVVDIFGSSIISTEGDVWKRHRKVVAPAFAEKSNMLVWKESLRQASEMLKSWSKIKGNTENDIFVNDAGPGTAHLALHVISGAGFGVSQVFDGEDEEQLGTNLIPGFNTAKLTGTHAFTFKEALHILITGVIWMMMVPEILLSKSLLSYFNHS